MSKMTAYVSRIAYLLFRCHRTTFTTKFLSFTNRISFNCYYPGNQLCSVDGRPLRFKLQALYTVRVSWMYPWGFTYAAMGPHKDKLQQTINDFVRRKKQKPKAVKRKQRKNCQPRLRLSSIAKEPLQAVGKKRHV